jgi:SAM-dependent methyltransferase
LTQHREPGRPVSFVDSVGYRDYRPPYLPDFFSTVARRLGLTRREAMLDLGCGLGAVTFGLYPHVGSVVGLDPDLPALQYLEARARERGCNVRLVHSRTEDAPPDLGRFDLITAGKSFPFMNSPATGERLERWLSPGGRILVCYPIETEPDGPAWKRVFFMTLVRWTRSESFRRTVLIDGEPIQGGDFLLTDRIEVHGERTISLNDVVQRAFGYVGTTPADLGDDADSMVADLRRLLGRFFASGPIVEKLRTVGLIYRRGSETR